MHTVHIRKSSRTQEFRLNDATDISCNIGTPLLSILAIIRLCWNSEFALKFIQNYFHNISIFYSYFRFRDSSMKSTFIIIYPLHFNDFMKFIHQLRLFDRFYEFE